MFICITIRSTIRHTNKGDNMKTYTLPSFLFAEVVIENIKGIKTPFDIIIDGHELTPESVIEIIVTGKPCEKCKKKVTKKVAKKRTKND